MALVLVTHDLGVVAALADRIAVMYAGRVVEEGAASALLARPAHPYTAGLLAAVPTLSGTTGGELPTIAGQPPAPGMAFRRLPIRAALPACRGAVPCASIRRSKRALRACRLPFSGGRGARPMSGGLDVRDVVVTYPRGEARPDTPHGGRRRELDARVRRDPRPRRRIRLRQVHARPCDPRPRSARGRGDPLAGTAHRRLVAPCLPRDSRRASARVPGPERVPRSAHDDCRERRRTASLAGTRTAAGRARGTRDRDTRRSRAAGEPDGPLSRTS